MSTPDPNIPETTDPLAETLHMLRLTGTLYCRGELTAPWAIAIPRLEGVMIFIVVTSGACWLELEGEGAAPSPAGQPGADPAQHAACALKRCRT
jgi:hypothetical protein